MRILHFGDISELWIQKISLTMVKFFTLVHESTSLWGHLRTMNFIIFLNHGVIIHTSQWKSFTALRGVFQGYKFPNFQPWWNHSLNSIKTHQIPCVSIYKNWRPSYSHCPVDISAPVRPWLRLFVLNRVGQATYHKLMWKWFLVIVIVNLPYFVFLRSNLWQ